MIIATTKKKKKMQNNQEHVSDEPIEYLPFEFLETKKV